MAGRLNTLREVRLEKLNKLIQKGINPFAVKFDHHISIKEAKQEHGQVRVVGRIVGWRAHGGSIFADLRDATGTIQLFFAQAELGGNYETLDLFDLGDFLGVEGELFTTQAGELTVKVSDFKLLTKAIRPIPSTWYGLKDTETRLRKRYLDLLVNPEEQKLFYQKARFWRAVREFLDREGFIEVETPALEPIPGGADANPFVTHHNALDQDFYLRISLELYQKRLLVGGFEKIYEVGKIFRNEGIDQEHLQDYLQMEFYWAYANYDNLMELTQRLYQYVISKTVGTLTTTYQGHTLDWSGTWPRVDYVEAFREKTGMDLDVVREKELREYAQKHNIHLQEKVGIGRIIDSIYKKTVRPTLIQPTFLINHPVAVSPLAKRSQKYPNRAERMQIMAGGTETSNGYSELNDPIDQLKRFEEQQKLRDAGDKEAQMMDLDFVEALEYGMPPAAGFGFSQRLFAVITDRPIRETVFFPPLKEAGSK